MPKASSSRVAIVVRIPGCSASSARKTFDSGLSGTYTTSCVPSVARPRQMARAQGVSGSETAGDDVMMSSEFDADIFDLRVAGQ